MLVRACQARIMYSNNLRLITSGLQDAVAKGGEREAGEGVLRQDYSNSLGLTHHESMSILPPLASRKLVQRAEAGEGVLREGRITAIKVRVTHHEYFASSGLQYAGAEGGGREAGEGELRQSLPRLSPAHVQGDEVGPLAYNQAAHTGHPPTSC
jgi:hypothetical protein